MEVPSGWLQVIRGPRPRSQHWPSGKANAPVTAQREVRGRWRQFKGAGTSQGPKLRMRFDAAREMAQSSVTRLQKALEAMGDVPGPAVEVLKEEVTKARAASKQPALDVEIDQCHKFHCQVRDADQGVGFTTCRGVCFPDTGPGSVSRECWKHNPEASRTRRNCSELTHCLAV